VVLATLRGLNVDHAAFYFMHTEATPTTEFIMSKTSVIPQNSPVPLAPYSPGTRATGEAIYISGMVPIDDDGKSFGIGDAAAQTVNVLESIKSVVEAAGGKMEDIAFSMIFLKSMDDYKKMNEVYAKYFPKNPPARYCIRADLVRDEFLVEISCIAHV
jgi:aminoacrylate peracid reductase